MSFLTRVTPLTSQLASSVARTTAPAFSVPAFRSISSTTKKDKGVADATKDTLKKADKTASDAALKGIETGQHVKESLKGTFGSTKGEAEAKSGELKDQASKYAQEGKAQAEAKSGEVKDEASKYAQEGKSKAGEAANDAKQKVHEATR
ncbi:uncharacterized protein EURHEDRAFT_378130 [Aspergillus ruber CBS 135680]|uniref:LEA domain protein n=1 Tax=Aspergillus ruber (strain CBS 135680) TaxID=1388766 RepID=A0A017SD13_ASPRC|nr:uncharacterized protein EURHEDRAFT_378130 [Aspergillus ruber CBS 135680]EYE94676.1 hypothetical protein EURHEDRAFT_378130 [Aspergillus ruber CBS 135680]